MAVKDQKSIRGIRILSCIFFLLCIFAVCAPGAHAAVARTVQLSQTKLLLMEDETARLTLWNAKKKVTWKSTKKSVATVTSGGKVRAKGAGSCEIVAKSDGETYRCAVVVCDNKKEYKYNKLQTLYKASQNKGKIVLAGSSSIAHWKNAASAFYPLRVVNMGIGGSTVQQWLKWYKKLIVKYDPSAVVLFPGTGNALVRGCSVDKAVEDTCKLIDRLRKALPGTPIYYVSIFRNTKQTKKWQVKALSNEKMEEYCAKTKNVYFVDVAGALANDGKLRPETVADDGIHLNSYGYSIWNRTVVPEVKKGIEKKKAAAK